MMLARFGQRSESRQLRQRDIHPEGTRADLERADPAPELFAQVAAQYRANREAYQGQLEGERSALAKAQQDLNSAIEMESRLTQTLPIYQEQEDVKRLVMPVSRIHEI